MMQNKALNKQLVSNVNQTVFDSSTCQIQKGNDMVHSPFILSVMLVINMSDVYFKG